MTWKPTDTRVVWTTGVLPDSHSVLLCCFEEGIDVTSKGPQGSLSALASVLTDTCVCSPEQGCRPGNTVSHKAEHLLLPIYAMNRSFRPATFSLLFPPRAADTRLFSYIGALPR